MMPIPPAEPLLVQQMKFWVPKSFFVWGLSVTCVGIFTAIASTELPRKFLLPSERLFMRLTIGMFVCLTMIVILESVTCVASRIHRTFHNQYACIGWLARHNSSYSISIEALKATLEGALAPFMFPFQLIDCVVRALCNCRQPQFQPVPAL